MADFLIDTDVLIDVLNGQEWVTAALTRLPREAAKLFSVVGEAELHAGISDVGSPEGQAVNLLLGSMVRVPIDGAIARRAGGYRHRFGRSHGTSLADALVAGTAAELGATLITRNRRHFPMREIEVMTPAEVAQAFPTASDEAT